MVGLLSQSVGPGAMDRALRDGVKYSRDWYSLDDPTIWLLKSLLEWGARGEPVNLALGGNVSVLRKLVRSGAGKKSITHAFYETIVSPLGEDIVLSLIEVLAASQDPNRNADFEEVLPNQRPPIVDCLATHPESAKLVRCLAELGCDVNAQFMTCLDDFAEPANVLAWSLRSSKGRARCPLLQSRSLSTAKVRSDFIRSIPRFIHAQPTQITK